MLDHPVQGRRKDRVQHAGEDLAVDLCLEQIFFGLAALQYGVSRQGDAELAQPIGCQHDGQQPILPCGCEGECLWLGLENRVEIFFHSWREKGCVFRFGNGVVGVLASSAHAEQAHPVVPELVEDPVIRNAKAKDAVGSMELLLDLAVRQRVRDKLVDLLPQECRPVPRECEDLPHARRLDGDLALAHGVVSFLTTRPSRSCKTSSTSSNRWLGSAHRSAPDPKRDEAEATARNRYSACGSHAGTRSSVTSP